MIKGKTSKSKIQILRGTYRDILLDTQGNVQWDSNWRSNLIVNKCNILLAMLMKGEPGMQGILYWAIGEGKDEWDKNCPSPQKTDYQLTEEITRRPFASDQIVYLDDTGQPPDTPTEPTDCLELKFDLNGADYVSNGFLPLREFGLFGGNAPEFPDTGYMINHVIHPRIDLSQDWTLERTIRLNFRAEVIPWEPIVEVGVGANFPITSIDGIGTEYSSDLNAKGVTTLEELIMVDPLQSIGNIPKVKLREFRAKARAVMELKLTNLSRFKSTPIANYSISKILKTQPDELLNAIGTSDPAIAIHLQEELAMLQIALDEARLKSMKFSELMDA